jgi:hypothetical protein
MLKKATKATPAYSCELRAKGEPVCEHWCGKCLASQTLINAKNSMRERYTGHGAATEKGAPNPYRATSDAAKWWQEGNEAASGVMATVQPPQAFYLGGPYQDGTYAVCDVFTGRIMQKFDPVKAPREQPHKLTDTQKVNIWQSMHTNDAPLNYADAIEAAATAPLLAKLAAQQKRIEVLEAEAKTVSNVFSTLRYLVGVKDGGGTPTEQLNQIIDVMASWAAPGPASEYANRKRREAGDRAALNPTEKQDEQG